MTLKPPRDAIFYLEPIEHTMPWSLLEIKLRPWVPFPPSSIPTSGQSSGFENMPVSDVTPPTPEAVETWDTE